METNLSVRGIERIKTTGDIGFGAIFGPDTTIAYAGQTQPRRAARTCANLVLQADFRDAPRRSYRRLVQYVQIIEPLNRARVIAAAGPGRQPHPIPVIPAAPAPIPDPKALCSNGAINISDKRRKLPLHGTAREGGQAILDRLSLHGSYALSKYTGFNGVVKPVSLDEHSSRRTAIKAPTVIIASPSAE